MFKSRSKWFFQSIISFFLIFFNYFLNLSINWESNTCKLISRAQNGTKIAVFILSFVQIGNEKTSKIDQICKLVKSLVETMEKHHISLATLITIHFWQFVKLYNISFMTGFFMDIVYTIFAKVIFKHIACYINAHDLSLK